MPLPVKMKHYEYHYRYFGLSYHKDKAIGKLKSVLVIIDLILFRFVAWRSTLYDVPSLYRFLSLVY